MGKTGERIWAVVRGRMESSRLPGKTMAQLAGRPSLQHMIERLRRVPSLDGIVIATTVRDEDDAIAACAREAGVPCHRGSPQDVLARTLAAAREVEASTIVSLTGDCPLVDPAIVERVVREYLEVRPDYASNALGGYRFPLGMDVEVFPTRCLAEVDRAAKAPRDREHVTLYFYEHPDMFRLHGIEPPERHRRPDLRLTLDTEDDLALIRAIYEALYPANPHFGLDEVLAYLDEHPELTRLNAHVTQRVP